MTSHQKEGRTLNDLMRMLSFPHGCEGHRTMPHRAEYHDGVCAGFTLFPERCRMSIRHSPEFGIVATSMGLPTAA